MSIVCVVVDRPRRLDRYPLLHGAATVLLWAVARV